MNNELRFGRFTSSEIFRLMTEGKAKGSFGKPALTYISERNMERRLGRTLKNDVDARSCDWGLLCEGYVFDMLSLEYSTQSKQTIVHPEIDYFSGSPDSVCYGQYNTVVEIKAPWTLKAFCEIIDGWKANGIQGIRDGHEQGEKYYWQLVANAILTDCKEGELIVFCPYQSEVMALMDRGASDYKWLEYASMDSIPWLVDDNGYYKNLNKFRFPIPDADKKALHDRVLEAGKMLVTNLTTQPI